MSDRRSFLRGLVSLPLIGGGVTLIGAPSAPVPLIEAAAMPLLACPRQRARYAWTAFSAAMDDLTAGADGWRVNGAGSLRMPRDVDPMVYLHLDEVSFDVRRDRERPKVPGSITETHRKLDLNDSGGSLSMRRRL